MERTRRWGVVAEAKGPSVDGVTTDLTAAVASALAAAGEAFCPPPVSPP